MSGINYTLFINPTGETRNIFILSSTQACATKQKVTAETKNAVPLNYSQNVHSPGPTRRRTFTRTPSYSKKNLLHQGEKYYWILGEQAI